MPLKQREPVTGRAKLYLIINETAYFLRYLDPYTEAEPAWRLTKTDGTSYDVHLSQHGAMCSCPDFLWCRDHKDAKGCKHCAALRAVGLLRKEAPREDH